MKLQIIFIIIIYIFPLFFIYHPHTQLPKISRAPLQWISDCRQNILQKMITYRNGFKGLHQQRPSVLPIFPNSEATSASQQLSSPAYRITLPLLRASMARVPKASLPTIALMHPKTCSFFSPTLLPDLPSTRLFESTAIKNFISNR